MMTPERPGLDPYLEVRDRLELFYREHFVYELPHLDECTHQTLQRGKYLDHFCKTVSYGHSPWEKEYGSLTEMQAFCAFFAATALALILVLLLIIGSY